MVVFNLNRRYCDIAYHKDFIKIFCKEDSTSNLSNIDIYIHLNLSFCSFLYLILQYKCCKYEYEYYEYEYIILHILLSLTILFFI